MPVRTWSAESRDRADLSDQTTQLLQRKSVLFALKQFLTGVDPAVPTGAWTVDRSSDATTAGTGDNWGATFTASKIQWNNEGAAHSWIVFKSPAGFCNAGQFLYICIDLRGDAGVDGNSHNMRMFASGYPFTGGTVNTRPTAISETFWSDGNLFQWIRNSVNGETWEWHGLRSTVGDFMFFIGKQGAGIINSAFWAFRHTDAEPEDNFPVSFGQNFAETGGGAFDVDFLQGSNASGRIGVVWVNGDGFSPRKTAIGTIVTNYDYDSNNRLHVDYGAGGNAINGKQYEWPVDVYTSGNGTAGAAHRGRWPDVTIGGNPLQTTMAPASGPPFTKCFVGQFWVPFTGKPTF